MFAGAELGSADRPAAHGASCFVSVEQAKNKYAYERIPQPRITSRFFARDDNGAKLRPRGYTQRDTIDLGWPGVEPTLGDSGRSRPLPKSVILSGFSAAPFPSHPSPCRPFPTRP
jgi:hypothetical protein